MRSNHKYGVRRDEGEPQIVEALEKAGWHVWRELPVDLLLYKPGIGFKALECKAPDKPLKPKKGPQEAFIALTGVAIVNNGIDAIREVEREP